MIAAVPQMNDTAVQAGYIIVFQDVRGKYGSEGDYVMTRPLRGPANPTKVDHATDYLRHHRMAGEERAGVATAASARSAARTRATRPSCRVVHPHPALKVAVPFAPMVDGWMGDDWFHNGAFRQFGALEYTYDQEAARKGDHKWWSGEYDAYDTYLRAGSAGALAKARGLDQLGFWRALAEHTSYDWWWQAQAVDKLLAKEKLTRADDDRRPACSIRKTSTARPRCSRHSRRRIRAASGCTSCSGRGITDRAGAKAAASARSSSKATPPAGSAAP